jgi:hypothetical protein
LWKEQRAGLVPLEVMATEKTLPIARMKESPGNPKVNLTIRLIIAED